MLKHTGLPANVTILPFLNMTFKRSYLNLTKEEILKNH